MVLPYIPYRALPVYFLLVVPILLGPLAGQAKTLKSPCPHTSPQTLFVIQKPPARLGIVECSLRLMLRRSPVRSTGAWAITMLTGAWVRGCGTCVTISNPAASTKQFLLAPHMFPLANHNKNTEVLRTGRIGVKKTWPASRSFLLRPASRPPNKDHVDPSPLASSFPWSARPHQNLGHFTKTPPSSFFRCCFPLSTFPEHLPN